MQPRTPLRGGEAIVAAMESSLCQDRDFSVAHLLWVKRKSRPLSKQDCLRNARDTCQCRRRLKLTPRRRAP